MQPPAKFTAEACLMSKRAMALVPDVLLLAGAASLSYGAWLAWQPAGFIVGGALAIIAGLKIARS